MRLGGVAVRELTISFLKISQKILSLLASSSPFEKVMTL